MRHYIILACYCVATGLGVVITLAVASGTLKSITAHSISSVELAKHQAFVECMDVHKAAGFLVGGSHDKSRKAITNGCMKLAGI